LAATVASEEVYSAFHTDNAQDALMHGPTFMGHAIACSAANASLDLFESENRLAQVDQINSTLKQKLDDLSDFDSVKEVRVLGAVGAVELHQPIVVGNATATFADLGVFIRPIGNVIYLAPSFTIATSDLETLCDSIKTFLSSHNDRHDDKHNDA